MATRLLIQQRLHHYIIAMVSILLSSTSSRCLSYVLNFDVEAAVQYTHVTPYHIPTASDVHQVLVLIAPSLIHLVQCIAAHVKIASISRHTEQYLQEQYRDMLDQVLENSRAPIEYITAEQTFDNCFLSYSEAATATQFPPKDQCFSQYNDMDCTYCDDIQHEMSSNISLVCDTPSIHPLAQLSEISPHSSQTPPNLLTQIITDYPLQQLQNQSNQQYSKAAAIKDDLNLDFSANVYPSSKGNGFTMPSSIKNTTTIPKKILKECRVLQQLDNKYIIIVSRGSIYCLDQHAADERVKYETYLHEWKKYRGTLVNRSMLISEDIGAAIEKHSLIPLLREFGFHFTLRQCNGVWKVDFSMMPIIYDEVLSESDFVESIEYLSREESTQTAKTTRLPAIDRILAYKACHSAIRFGDDLTNDECGKLVQALAETDLPFQCAHGRPSIVPLVSILEEKCKKGILL